MRLFAGLEFDDDTRGRIDVLTRRLRPLCDAGGFVPARNLHLTLHFFGETDPGRVPAVEAALRKAAAGHGPFRLYTGGFGSFGGPDACERTLWLGVDKSDALAALQADVEKELVSAGFAAGGRDFRAHITLARRGVCDPEVLGRGDTVPVVIPCEAVTLFESVRTAGGMVYRTVSRFPLGVG